MADISLYIVVPSARDWKGAFGASLMGVIHHLSSVGLSKHKLVGLGMNAIQGASCLSRARQAGLGQAISSGYTHLLMLDDDMTFPADTVDRLLNHEKPVVAANYCRKLPGKPVPLCMGLDGALLESTGKTGLEEVGFVGGGVVMVDVAAIKDIPAPHFCVLWDEDRKDYWGEDLFFCDKLRNAGVQIYVDHGLSQLVRHVGDYSYGFGG